MYNSSEVVEMLDVFSVTYDRKVDHCEPTKYVKMVTISEVSPALNSDRLDSIKFEEIGWQVISERGRYKIGDVVMFIPPESVLPRELSDLLNVTNYLSKGKIRVVRLRGNRSEGLIVPSDIVKSYLSYIMHWEDLPEACMFGMALSHNEISNDFMKFYKMENILNAPHTFDVGEEIWYSEKVHGCNMRFGLLKHPRTEEITEYVGSHRMCLKKEGNEDNLFWCVYNNVFAGKFPEEYLFFAEAFGPKVQDLEYGRGKHDGLVFAIMKKGEYIPISEVMRICDEYGIPRVNFRKIRYESIEQMRELADLPSEVSIKNQMREGVVLVSDKFPNRMAKVISFKYLTRKNGTERH